MKRTVLFLLIVLVMGMSGCARANHLQEEVLPDAGGSPVQQEMQDAPANSLTEEPAAETQEQNEMSEAGKKEDTAPPVAEQEKEEKKITPVAVPADEASFAKLSELEESFTLQDYLVFKGRKTASLGDMGFRCMFPIELKVEEVFYGDVQKGQTLVMREIIGTFRDDDVVFPVVSGDLEKIEDDTQYIFILRKTVDSETREEYYTYVSRNHSFSKVSDRAALASKVKSGKATKLEQFRSSVLETYLQEPDLKIDLRSEVTKLVGEQPRDATQEELLNALPAEQKALFEKLIRQYGVK